MMTIEEQEILVGQWESKDGKTIMKLKPRGDLTLKRETKRTAKGSWSCEGDMLHLNYNETAGEILKFELGMRPRKYSCRITLKIANINADRLSLMQQNNKIVEIRRNHLGTERILRRDKTIANVSVSLFLSCFASYILRKLLTPEIPTFMIAIVSYFVILHCVKNYQD
ncbi:hypothetical protein [Niabella drilacis]|uniref:Uncharacterized protein n=1 Tax=Niabella drilacis (strain DSM 25811 / CCM 8410 / CCUG 62505 / LMG 26954 / E90) TaxID=1285928 RepID=A0A1G6UK81_NIADE|nr:hypothetical protein [Niabella drilacis]SDD41681.1 hypothetical protein SAMN04487894_1098 [Niabella drilacis]